MSRIHLIEFGDQEWAPEDARNGGLEILRIGARLSGVIDEITKLLGEIVDETGVHTVVDLCSGAGGPLPYVIEKANKQNLELRGTMTDLYPNPEAMNEAAKRSNGKLAVETEPIDATDVPDHLSGIRTIFNGLHHFRPDDAKKILRDAAHKKQPFLSVEFAGRYPSNISTILTLAPASFLLRPFIRPFNWKHWMYTYLIPLIPAGLLFDGFVSCLRVYDPSELEDLTADIEGMNWRSGAYRPSGIFPGYITYLIGIPT